MLSDRRAVYSFPNISGEDLSCALNSIISVQINAATAGLEGSGERFDGRCMIVRAIRCVQGFSAFSARHVVGASLSEDALQVSRALIES